MSPIFQDLAFRFFSVFGIQPTMATPLDDVSDLISSLRPRMPACGLVRLGPSGDGGYLVPDDLDGIAACFSPGVSDVSGFEKDCAERGMSVFMADASVAGPAESHPNFAFEAKYVGAIDDAEFMTLDSWIKDNAPPDGDLLLQMDIEGAEYESVLATPQDVLERFRIIVIECHQLQALFSHPFFMLASRAFEKILQTHTCVHATPNNGRGSVKKGSIEIPRVTEFTFLRNDRLGDAPLAISFPHPLDEKNVAGPDLVLPRCWYGD